MKETNEERIKRLKEEELNELKKRKAFLEQIKQAKKMQSLNNAMSELENMTSNDDTQEWIDKLGQETLINEAKTEMFLEKHKDALSEEEIMKENAKKLLEIMKNTHMQNSENQIKSSLTLGDQEFKVEYKSHTEQQNTLDNNEDKPKSII